MIGPPDLSGETGPQSLRVYKKLTVDAVASSSKVRYSFPLPSFRTVIRFGCSTDQTIGSNDVSIGL